MARKPPNFAASIRRSQMAVMYGPGAIINLRTFGGAPISALSGSLETWDKEAPPPGLRNRQICHLRRLENKLGVNGFRLPPVALERQFPGNDGMAPSLVARRFPQWLTCPTCNRLKPSGKWQKDTTRADPVRWCGNCSQGSSKVFAVPVRFVMACANGHLAEFPWAWWLRNRPPIGEEGRESCRHLKLKLTQGSGLSLSSLILTCEVCSRSVRMSGIFGTGSFKGLSCKGSRPWLDEDEPEECTQSPIAVQRNSSSLYHPKTVSALDIPPWSHSLQELLGIYWERIYRWETVESAMHYLEVIIEDINEELGTEFSAAQLAEEVIQIKAVDNEADADMKVDEYKQFTRTPEPGEIEIAEFRIVPKSIPDSIVQFLNHLVSVERLREVRALTGFSRLRVHNRECALSRTKKRWLPAVENRGEGLFFSLSGDFIRSWEQGQSADTILARAEKIRIQADRFYEDMGVAEEERVVLSPQLILVHTISHLLIRQISLESGYSAASIKERIYSGPDMCGVLLYTASAGSEGTLGGLSRLANPDRFEKLFLNAVDSGKWCSSDPLCIESVTSMSEALNNSACHACLLLPETCCDYFNHFLDRALIAGRNAESLTGAFD